MKKLDLSIVAKTFMRPECLKNFLQSIYDYQNAYDLQFAEVVITDDSDETNSNLNKRIIDSYAEKLNIVYASSEYRTLNAAGGRNLAVETATSKYILLCDDDYILDTSCDIEECLNFFKERNDIDILGGFYKEITDINATECSLSNWLGFYFSDSINVMLIYTDVFPEFTFCTVVHNFFIAEKACLENNKWNINLKTNEHNDFFLHIRKNGYHCAFTNKLYVKHFHIKKKFYDNSFRHITVADNEQRKIALFVISNDKILHSTNITLADYKKYLCTGTGNTLFSKTGPVYSLDLKGLRLSLDLERLPMLRRTARAARTLLRRCSQGLRALVGRPRLLRIRERYPRVLSTRETLEEVALRKKSIVRFGAGEFLLLLGQGLGQAGAFNEYQAADAGLQARLAEILQAGSDGRTLVSIVPFSIRMDDQHDTCHSFSYWENFLLNHFEHLKKYLSRPEYGNTLVSRSNVFHENSLQSIRSIWQSRKVLFVCGEESQFSLEPELFDNIERHEFIYGPARSAYKEYNSLLEKIRTYDTSWLVFLALGPTATVLAYDLSRLGFQALDLGHLPNSYRQWKGRAQTPEAENAFLQELLSKRDIYSFLSLPPQQ